MDIANYNKSDVEDRQVDTLIGLCKGLLADGKIVQQEAEFLQAWLVQNSYSKNPLIVSLLDRINVMLEDGVLDNEESQALLALLKQLTGENSALGELAKPSTLPISNPPPEIETKDKKFLFTGKFVYGARADCMNAVRNKGGIVAGKDVTKDLDYLVIGTYVNENWVHETFGRKIQTAVRYREKYSKPEIVTEEHWLKQLNLVQKSQ